MIKTLLAITRKISIGSLYFTACFVIAVILFLQSNIPQDTLKQIIESQLQNKIGRHVSIDSLSGNILKTITLHNISLFLENPQDTRATINTLTFKLSPLSLLLNRGDVFYGLKSIDISDITVFLNRLEDGSFELKTLFKKTNKSKKPLINIKTALTISNLNIIYRDEKGWGKNHLEYAFEENLSFSTIELLIDTAQNSTYTASGFFESTKSNIRSSGAVNLTSKSYNLDFMINDLPLDKWGSYILPVKGVSVETNSVNIHGALKNKSMPTTTKLPFLYDLDIEFEKNSLNLSFLPTLITIDKGHLKLANTINSDKMTLTFKNIIGESSNIPFTGHGWILPKDKKIDLHLLTKQSNASNLYGLLPSLTFLSLDGKASASVDITGSLLSPDVSGTLKSDSLAIFDERINQLIMDYLYRNDFFYFSIHEATSFNSPLRSKGKINTSEDITTFTIDSTLTGIDLDQFIHIIDDQSIGTSNLKNKIIGSSDVFSIFTSISSPEAEIFNQSIPSIDIEMLIKNDQLDHVSATAEVNTKNSILTLSSTHTDGSIDFTLIGNDIVIFDFEPGASKNITGSMTIGGEITLLDTTPFTLLNASIIATSNEFPYQNSRYTNFLLDTEYKLDTFILNNLTLENETEKTSIDGSFQKEEHSLIHLTFDQLNLKDHFIAQTFIPEIAKPFEGKLSGDLWFIPSKNLDLLLNYEVSGNLIIDDAKIQNQTFDKITTSFSSKEIATMKDISLKKNDSFINAHGVISPDNFNIKIEDSSVLLEDFKVFLFQYGNFSGTLEANGLIKGPMTTPSFSLSLTGSQLKSNYLLLENIKGNLTYSDNQYTFEDFTLKDSTTDFKIDGYFKHLPLHSPPYAYKLDIDINHIEIEPFSKLFQNALNEAHNFSETFTDIEKEKIPNSNVTHSISNNYEISFDITKNSLFSVQDVKQALHYFSTIKQKHTSLKRPKVSDKKKPLSGSLKGILSLVSHDKIIPKVKGVLSVTNFKTPYFETESLEISIKESPYFLNFDLDVNQGIIVGKTFETMNSSGTLTYDGSLEIKKAELQSQNQRNKNILNGTFPLNIFWEKDIIDSPMDLTLELKGNDSDILSFMHPSIQSITNEGDIIIHFGGTATNFSISAPSFELQNTHINFNDNTFLFKEIYIPSTSLSIINNELTIPNTSFLWKSLDKDKRYNSLDVNGFVKLNKVSLIQTKEISLITDMHTSPTDFKVSLPGIYTGDISLSPMSMIGTYSIPLSSSSKKELNLHVENETETGPILTGRIKLKNGNFELPKLNDATISPTIGFNLKIDLKKDVFLSGSFLGSGSLAAISVDLELEETIHPLIIKGTINNPKIENKIGFKDGNINVFNRSFSLLSHSDQAQYSTQVEGEILPNEIYFNYVPIINLSAVTIIDPIEEETSSSDISGENSDYSHIVSKISGPINALSLIRFDYYTSDSDSINNNNDINYVQAYYLSDSADQNAVDKSDRTALLKLLLPELFADSSDEILTEYGETRVNLLFKRSILRPLEKQIAEGIGLYDLKIDYDLGSDLFNSTDSRSLGINMMQQLFSDQLYLRVKTDIELESESQSAGNSVGISEVELTYYLLKNFSLNYANIKDDINTDTNFKPKLSVKFSHEF
jgi:hypothetical protein